MPESKQKRTPPRRVNMTLVQIKNDYDQVHSYYFTTDEELTWTPGQYVHLIAPGCAIQKGKTVQHMSIASTPDEKHMIFSMDLSSNSFYKQKFGSLSVGDVVQFFKVKGHFVLDTSSKDAVFIAGGIGMTPIRSMIMDIERRKLPVTWKLLHIARNNGHLYKEELKAFGNEQVRTDRAGSAAAVTAMVAANPSATYYICGSHGFINAFVDMLKQQGIPENRIRTENFKQKKSAVNAPARTASAEVKGTIEVNGTMMSAPMAAIACLLADTGAGRMVEKNMKKGEHKTPEMLAINPFGTLPSMTDGNFHLGDSAAIARYIANKYAPQTYGGDDLSKKAVVDWALAWGSDQYKDTYGVFWYPSMGIFPMADDMKPLIAKGTKKWDQFAEVFLNTSTFIGGATPSIADYRFAYLLRSLDHPLVETKSGFTVSPKLKAYYKAFFRASPNAESCYNACQAFMDSKRSA